MRKQLGFTLVELFVTVLIIGVLGAIAFPQYMKTIYKSNRSEGKSWLTDVDQRMQRCFSAYGKYNDKDNCGVYKELTGAGITTRDRGFYLITIENDKEISYDLVATAVLAPQTEDTSPVDCTKLTLTSKGEKKPADCWR